MGSTIAEKTLCSHSDASSVSPGELVTIEPDWIFANDLSIWRGIQRMDDLGHEAVESPERVVIAMDHHVPSSDETITTHMKKINEWARGQGIEHFFDSGSGILHNITTEEGFALPGQAILGGDSHTTTQGAFGAFSTGISHTDLGESLGTGELWVKVPETRKIVVDETIPDGTTAKDLGLRLMEKLGTTTAIYDALEYYGSGIEALEMYERATLSNLAVELGAQCGIVPPDDRTHEYLDGRAQEEYTAVHADDDADYVAEYEIDAGSLEPLVAKPSSVDNVAPVDDVEGTSVEQVFVGTCNNARYEDIKAFSERITDEQVAQNTRLIVVPGSKRAYKRMNETGISNAIMDAGGVINASGCGPCFGAHGGVLGEGETCVGTMNRNFPGRMGPGEIYISSPETAAATALYGEITNPVEVF